MSALRGCSQKQRGWREVLRVARGVDSRVVEKSEHSVRTGAKVAGAAAIDAMRPDDRTRRW